MTADLRGVMRLWPAGVTVVTTAHAQQRFGATANSFTSVSMSPPLVLVCLNKTSDTLAALQASGYFGICVLGEGQTHISEQFAGSTPLPDGADRFHQMAHHTSAQGVPLLTEAIAQLECRLHTLHDGSTHLIVIGEVLHAQRADDPVIPLLYVNRGYRRVVME
jgi:flavin reductase (DIM6/NTAB) family NADH-FMN oxidoreductase RutF